MKVEVAVLGSPSLISLRFLWAESDDELVYVLKHFSSSSSSSSSSSFFFFFFFLRGGGGRGLTLLRNNCLVMPTENGTDA